MCNLSCDANASRADPIVQILTSTVHTGHVLLTSYGIRSFKLSRALEGGANDFLHTIGNQPMPCRRGVMAVVVNRDRHRDGNVAANPQLLEVPVLAVANHGARLCAPRVLRESSAIIAGSDLQRRPYLQPHDRFPQFRITAYLDHPATDHHRESERNRAPLGFHLPMVPPLPTRGNPSDCQVEVMRWGFHRPFNPSINNARSDKLASGMWADALHHRVFGIRWNHVHGLRTR